MQDLTSQLPTVCVILFQHEMYCYAIWKYNHIFFGISLDKKDKDFFLYFSTKAYVVTLAQKVNNSLYILMELLTFWAKVMKLLSVHFTSASKRCF